MNFADCHLDTRRLRLRPLQEDDAPSLLGLFSDPQVMRFWSTPPWTGLEQAQAMVAQDREALARGEFLRLAITRRDDAVLVGTCTLFNLVAQCRRAEIGFALAPAFWGRAYMDESLRALLRHGFTTMALKPRGSRHRPAQRSFGAHAGTAGLPARRRAAPALDRR